MKPISPEQLRAILNGNLSDLHLLRISDHDALTRCAEMLTDRTVRKENLIQALLAFRSGKITARDLQQWASFLRRGYLANATTIPLTAINIPYDFHYEEIIADVIAQLDEIGDAVDGNFNISEANTLLSKLR